MPPPGTSGISEITRKILTGDFTFRAIISAYEAIIRVARKQRAISLSVIILKRLKKSQPIPPPNAARNIRSFLRPNTTENAIEAQKAYKNSLKYIIQPNSPRFPQSATAVLLLLQYPQLQAWLRQIWLYRLLCRRL